MCRNEWEVQLYNFSKGINDLILTLLVNWNTGKDLDHVLTKDY